MLPMPSIFITIFIVLLGVAAFVILRRLYPPAPKPAVTLPVPVPPAPPTIVILGGEAMKSSEQTTREQLLQQFSQLLQKYEQDVQVSRRVEALPESTVVPESRRLSSPKEAALVCGFTSKNLLRTVAGNWHKKEERIVPPPGEGATEKGIAIVTLWARDIYNEWEVFTCSLPRGHSARHHGTTSKAYTQQSSVTEERTYTAKQKILPPKPHFTDRLPVVDVAPSQVITSDSTATSDQVITPDETSRNVG